VNRANPHSPAKQTQPANSRTVGQSQNKSGSPSFKRSVSPSHSASYVRQESPAKEAYTEFKYKKEPTTQEFNDRAWYEHIKRVNQAHKKVECEKIFYKDVSTKSDCLTKLHPTDYDHTFQYDRPEEDLPVSPRRLQASKSPQRSDEKKIYLKAVPVEKYSPSRDETAKEDWEREQRRKKIKQVFKDLYLGNEDAECNIPAAKKYK
jgi:hypothetical protein